MLFPVIFRPGGSPRASFVRFRGAGCRHLPQKSTGSGWRSGQRHHAKAGLVPQCEQIARWYPLSEASGEPDMLQTRRGRRFRSKATFSVLRWCRSERLQVVKNHSSVPFQNGTIARNKRGHENACHGIGCVSCRTCRERDVRCASRRQTRAAGHEERGHGSGR